MTYEQFIEELRRRIAEGEKLLQQRATHQTKAFRDWRHATHSLVSHAKQLGHNPPGDYHGVGRAYQAAWAGAMPTDDAEEFDRDMESSLGELRFLVENFDKFGEPGKPPAKAASTAAPASGGHTFNFTNSTVGAVQTGAHSTANVQLDATSLKPLLDAIEQLRSEIAKGSVDLPAPEREQSLQVIDHLVTAAQAPKPNKYAISGLVRGVSDSIRTASAVPGAWHAVKVAALALFGLHL